jgi:hypothetical protein
MDLKCAFERLPGDIEVWHREKVPFLQLICQPKTFGQEPSLETSPKDPRDIGKEIQRRYKELKDLGVKEAAPLVLMHSQSQAAMRVLSHRFSVIWGPPGTGKTHTIALSLLRLLDVRRRSGIREQTVVFITAMTHAAIQACLRKLRYLMHCVHAVDSVHTLEHWIDNVTVENVLKGKTHDPPKDMERTYVYAGTVFQVCYQSPLYQARALTGYHSCTISQRRTKSMWIVLLSTKLGSSP